MPKRLDRSRYEKMKKAGERSVVVNTRLTPREILRLDEIATRESRSLCSLLAVLARRHLETEFPWRRR